MQEISKLQSVRQTLREATRTLHDQLDAALGTLALRPDLSLFLAVQHEARRPIEEWLERVSDAPPPRQTPLLADDLAALGATIAPRRGEDWSGEPAEAVGLQWLLAGSSLGNRAILMRRRKNGLTGGERFLGDPAMETYWHSLKPQLERPIPIHDTEHAVRGAVRGFRQFLACLNQACDRAAA